MFDEVSSAKLKKALGKRVEVLAFSMVYVGTLKSVDTKNSLIRIEDKEDYVVLEIERIESFRLVAR